MPKSQQSSAGEAVDTTVEPFADLTGDSVPFEVDGEVVRLIGSISASSKVKAFPARAVCPETGARDMEPMLFGPEAMLYSFSTVHVSASREVPYTLGYIDFPEGIRTLAIIRGAELRCDMPVVLKSDGQDWWAEAKQ